MRLSGQLYRTAMKTGFANKDTMAKLIHLLALNIVGFPQQLLGLSTEYWNVLDQYTERLSEFSGPLDNLNDILKPLDSHKCFVSVTIYKRIDLLELILPVVLRKLYPVYKDESVSETTQWALKPTIIDGNVSDTKSVDSSCSSSSSFRTVPTLVKCESIGMYSRINAFAWYLASKVLTCQVHIQVFLPVHEHLQYLEVFAYSTEYWMSIHPALVPVVYIVLDEKRFLTEEKILQVCKMLHERKNVSSGIQHSLGTTMENPLLFGMLTQNTPSNLVVSSFELFHDCDFPHIKQFSMEVWNSLSWPELVKATSIGINEPVTYELPVSTFFNQIKGLVRSMRKCQPLLRSGNANIATIMASIISSKMRVGDSHAHIMQSILGNYSLLYFGPCSTDGLREFNLLGLLTDLDAPYITVKLTKDARSLDSTMILKDSLHVFRFITCVTRGKTTLPFQDLINVFDFSTWVAIVLCTYLTAVITNLTLGKLPGNSVSDHIQTILRILLDQDPLCSKSIMAQNRHRVIIAAVLLAGIVLNNAYRFDNIYNMILPRKRIPYERLDELISDQFKLYSRIKITQIPKLYSPDDFIQNKSGSDLLNLIVDNITERLRDNSNTVQETIDIFPGAFPELMYATEYSDETMKLDNHGSTTFGELSERALRLLTLPQVTLKAMIRQYLQLLDELESSDHNLNNSDSSAKFVSVYIVEEENILERMLKTSGNVATIMPVVDCFRYKQNLQSSGVQCDVGIEQYSMGTTGVTFEGRLNIRLLRRIRWMEQSGVIDWWNSYLQQQPTPDVTKPVRAASMAGNILVVFIVLLAGVFAGSFFWLLEIGVSRKTIFVFQKMSRCKFSQLKIKISRGRHTIDKVRCKKIAVGPVDVI